LKSGVSNVQVISQPPEPSWSAILILDDDDESGLRSWQQYLPHEKFDLLEIDLIGGKRPSPGSITQCNRCGDGQHEVNARRAAV
jgi:hypothetical protein